MYCFTSMNRIIVRFVRFLLLFHSFCFVLFCISFFSLPVCLHPPPLTPDLPEFCVFHYLFMYFGVHHAVSLFGVENTFSASKRSSCGITRTVLLLLRRCCLRCTPRGSHVCYGGLAGWLAGCRIELCVPFRLFFFLSLSLSLRA